MILCFQQVSLAYNKKGTLNIPMLSGLNFFLGPPKSYDELGGYFYLSTKISTIIIKNKIIMQKYARIKYSVFLCIIITSFHL